MSTLDLAGSVSIPVDAFGKHFVLKNTVDFTVAANQLATTETMDIFNIPADVRCTAVIMKVVTADTHITDINIGTVASTCGFMEAGTLAATGWIANDVDEAYSTPGVGYIATSDAAIVLTNIDANTIDEAVVEFYALCEDLR